MMIEDDADGERNKNDQGIDGVDDRKACCCDENAKEQGNSGGKFKVSRRSRSLKKVV